MFILRHKIQHKEVRRDTSRILQSVREDGDVVHITQHGRAVVVILDCDQYHELLAQLEELSDQAAIEETAGEPAQLRGVFDRDGSIRRTVGDVPATETALLHLREGGLSYFFQA